MNLNSIILGDCLEIMKDIPDNSIDLILCDLPYGTTNCVWDTIIPFDSLWSSYKRIIKLYHPIVLFGTQPFTSLLVCSNLDYFKYAWVWKKSRPGGFVSAKLKPLKETEDIIVFSNGTTANCSSKNMPYFPQGLVKIDKPWKRPQKYDGSDKGISYKRESHELSRVLEFTNYPKNILHFNNPNNNLLHPTEKPVDLLEYLIKTYTKENELVLDNCAGSGSTGVACRNTNRNYILIEKEEKYYNICLERLKVNN